MPATTIRISNINVSSSVGDLRKFCADNSLPLASRQRAISLVTTSEGYKVATISFADPETFKKALILPLACRELDGMSIEIDSHFEGLTVFSEGHNLDIVALHGLKGHAFQTWEFQGDHGENFMWLRDSLPKQFPGARIMTYGYNANVFSGVSTGRIRTFAQTFLESLKHMRDADSTQDRPLIIIGYSMGGLIVKQALLYANSRADDRFGHLMDSVCGVVFIATPHQGGSGVNAATFVANFLKTFNFNVRADLIKDLDPNSLILFDLTDDFRQLVELKGIEVATLFESKKTKIAPWPAKRILTVDERSAILGVARERKAVVNADHTQICKFKNQTDPPFIIISEMIRELGHRRTLTRSRNISSKLLTATTARISHISVSTVPQSILNFCKEKELALDSKRRLIPLSLVDTHEGNKVATISFADPETLERALKLPFADRELDGDYIEIDSTFEGFTVFSDGRDVELRKTALLKLCIFVLLIPVYSIVALHGLNGHAFQTWEYEGDREDHFMWLRDGLPKKFPGARVMTYGYSADAFSELSAGRIRSFAETFLEDLLHMRSEHSARGRPLIIVAYSLGGLIIKQALIVANIRADKRFDSILNSVCGVVFLGTPHQGGSDPANFVANYTKTINVGLMKDFDPSSLALFDLTLDFRQLVSRKGVEIATLFELKKTMIGYPPQAILVVDQRSAILSVPRERIAGVNADHLHMCKFRSSTDPSLSMIMGMIDELEKAVVPRITTRNALVQPLLPDDLKHAKLGAPLALEKYPVLELGPYTYWALSYIDNRYEMAILAYERGGRLVRRWSQAGSRYINRIRYDAESRRVTFYGEGETFVSFDLSDLRISA